MPNRSFLARSVLAAILAIGAPICALAQQPQLKIFDAHLHYNDDALPVFPVDEVIAQFRRSGVAGILANSRPNDGTRLLVETKAPGLWVVPFIRPYRIPDDMERWFNDPSIYELIETEYRRGDYRGIGEFHLFGSQARGPWVKKAVDFAVEHDLFLHAHADEQALLALFDHNPKAKVIWAHTGFSVPAARVRELIETHPALICELSYRAGITRVGRLTAEWRDLFARHSDRFLLGSDTWVNERWYEYGSVMKGYREWLTQLPPDQARRIAYGNAERLFDGRTGE
jgi:Amidohydrolase